MKRILFLLIGIVSSVSMLADDVYEDEYGVKYTYDPSNVGAGATLTDGKGLNTSTYTIKAFFEVGTNVYHVTSIAQDAFANKVESSYNDNYTPVHVIIPEGITTIGASAFRRCSNLKLLELPASLTSIEGGAFRECNRIGYVSCGFESSRANLLNNISSDSPMTLYVPETYLNAYQSIELKSKFKGGIYGGNFKLVDYEEMSYVCATGSGNEATLYLGKDESDITVPNEFTVEGTTYHVYNIGSRAFYGFSNLANLIIENGITSIHKSAFYGCTKLKRLDIRSLSITIGSEAFNNCSNLLYVCSNLSNPIATNTLNALPFNDLMKLYIRDDNVWSSYKNNQDLLNQFTGGIYKGGNLLEVADKNSGMTYVIADGSGDATLSIGKNDPEVTVPEKIVYNSSDYYVTTIAKEAFKDKNKIIELTIEGNHFIGIGYNAFYNNSSLRNVVLPSTLSIISDKAFWGCKGLVHVVCKNAVPTSISENAFMISNNTWSSATLYVPLNTTSLYGAAIGWKKFADIQEGYMVEVTSDKLTYACLDGASRTATVIKAASDVTRVTIPETINIDGIDFDVTSIAEKAFQKCSNLEKVVLPSSLTSIGDYAFDGCSNLKYVVNQMAPNQYGDPVSINDNVFSNYQAILFVPAGDNGNYSNATGWGNFAKILEGDMGEGSKDNMNYVYATYSGVAILVKSETTEQDVTIPHTVEFSNAYYTVTDIDKSAFKGRTSLINLTIADGGMAGIKTIGAYAFQNCSNLQKVVLPSTLTKIDDYAFAGCNKIKEVISKVVAKTNSPFTFSDNVFSETIYPTATVYVPIGSEPGTTTTAYKGKNGWNNFTNYIEGEKLQATVSKMTYEYLTGPKTATLIGTTIDDQDKDVTIPDFVNINGQKYTVTAINASVFKDKASIVNLKVSENVKTIGDYAFYNCSGLKKVELPSTLTFIGKQAFDKCTKITHVCSKVKEPFAFNTTVFPSSIYSTATLYVPDGTKDRYKAKDGWNTSFSNIAEGYLVDVLTLDEMTYDCVKTGEGASIKQTAILTKSVTTSSNVVIPDSVAIGSDNYRVTTIGKSAFSNNSKLVNITIPEFVESIGESAFDNCNYIENIISKIKSPSVINNNVFSISSATLYVPVGTRSVYKTTDGWSKFTTVYEGLMKEKPIVDMVYHCATGDKTAILVSTTTTATDVIIPDSFAIDNDFYKVIAINQAVFKGKTSIVNLTLPATLTQIGDNAFNGCNKITTITCKAIEPPVITDNVFPVNTATLYVPEGSRSKYQNAAGWNNFATVFEGVWKEVTLEDGMTFVYATGDKTATLTKTTSSEKDVTIRGSFVIDDVTYKVTAIANSVFKSNTSVANLKISENIKTIGAYAFQGCTNLKRLELPSTLTDIGDKAFDGCKNLTHVCSKAKTPTDIPENTFSVYTAKLFVPDGTLGAYQARLGWNKFNNVYLGYFVDEMVLDNMTFICLRNGEGETMTNNATLTKSATSTAYVSIPASVKIDDVSYKVTTIGKSAFNGNSKLVNLTLSENIKAIEENAFAECLKITDIISMIQVPFNISDNVFSSYTATLYVPDNTRSLYKNALGWQNFTTILQGVRSETTTEDGMTYVYATGDKTATLTKASVSEKDLTVPGTFKLGEDTYTVVAIDKAVFKDKKTIVNLKIAENIKTIGANAFQNCVNLEKIDLPSSLLEIGENAFDGCTRLSHIVSRVKSPFGISDNVFSASTFETAKLYVPSVTSADYKKTAGWENFKNILVGEMKEVTLNDMTYYCVQGPNIATLVKASTGSADVTVPPTVKDGEITYNVTEVGAYAFSGIGSLEKITISAGVKSVGIGAFQNCNKLKEVVLPESLEAIGEYAFDKCTRLALVVSHIKDPFTVDESVFPVNVAKLDVPIGTVEQYRSIGGWNGFTTILEGDMLETEIDGMSYVYVTGSRTATLVKGVTSASELTILSTIRVDGVDYTVTAIDESAFANATKLVTLKISEGIKTIGANAFKNCSYLNKLSLPSTLISIGSSAFDKCDRLTHIECSMKKPLGISNNVFTTTTYNNATLYVPVETSEIYAQTEGWLNFKSVLEGEIVEVVVDGMTYVCVPNLQTAKLTKGLSNVKNVVIPSTITVDDVTYDVIDIDRAAFYGFGTIENLIVSEGVQTIGLTAFKNCYKLKTIELPSTLTTIGDYAFENCSKLTTIVSHTKSPVLISDNVFSVSSMTVYVPAGSAKSYLTDEIWGKFTIEEVATITIGNAKQLAYYSDKDLDFKKVDGLKAYVATGYDKTTGTIWLTRVYDVPAKTGILMMGDAGTYNVPLTTAGSNTYYKNLFKGTLEPMTLQATDGANTNYYLSNGKEGVGFYKVTKEGGIDLGANRAYLSVPTEIPAVGTAGETENIVVSSAGQVAYCSSQSLDFTDMETEGVRAYTATGYDYKTGTIWLTRVKKVPAKVGILIMAPEGGYEVPTVSVASVYGNMLKGTLTATTIQQTETIDGVDYINYYLSNGTSGVGFYKVTKEGGVALRANRSYLPIPKQGAAGTRGMDDNPTNFSVQESDEVIGLCLFGSADGTTGIGATLNDNGEMMNDKDVWYNLHGQRVDKPGRGLYIKNGKKIIVK